MNTKWFSAPVLAAVLAVTAPAAALSPLDSETKVDPHPSGIYFYCSAVAGKDDGSFAVAWLRQDSPTRNTVLARVGDPGGALEALQVVDGTGNGSTPPLLAPAADGFTALWHRSIYEPPEKYRFPHMLLELDAEGAPVGEALDLKRGGIEVTPRPGGGATALWKAGKVLNLQLLAADGTAVAPPVKLQQPKALEWRAVHGPAGGLVVLWHSATFRGSRYTDLGYSAQRFDRLGRPAGKPFAVLPGRGARDLRRDLVWAALGADGTFAVAAAVDQEPAGLGAGRVTLRTYDKNDRLIGGPYPVTSADRDPGEISYPAGLAVAPDGRVLLVWAQYRDPHLPEAQARVFTREAKPVGEPLRLYSEGNPEPYVQCADAAWAGGSWVVTWIGASGSIFDVPARTESIYVRRFAGEE